MGMVLFVPSIVRSFGRSVGRFGTGWGQEVDPVYGVRWHRDALRASLVAVWGFSLFCYFLFVCILWGVGS
jgi:hypothetical protein